MRRLSSAAALAALVAGVVGVAQAVTPTTAMKSSVGPTKAGTKAKPSNVKLSLELITTPNPSDPAFATKSTVVHLDKNLKFGGKYLKTCSAKTVRANNRKCPKGSKVGSGQASASALGMVENLKITAYNGPGGKKLELLLDAALPLAIHDVLEGVLQPDSGTFGQKLVVNIPPSLQQPVQDVYATLTEFKTVVKGTGSKKRPYVGLTGCTNRSLAFQSDFVFSDDSTSTATTTAPCS